MLEVGRGASEGQEAGPGCGDWPGGWARVWGLASREEHHDPTSPARLGVIQFIHEKRIRELLRILMHIFTFFFICE